MTPSSQELESPGNPGRFRFFDTELLVLAEKLGYRIKDVPVRWVDDDDSRVRIISAAWKDVRGVFCMRWWLWRSRTRVAEARRQRDYVT